MVNHKESLIAFILDHYHNLIDLSLALIIRHTCLRRVHTLSLHLSGSSSSNNSIPDVKTEPWRVIKFKWIWTEILYVRMLIDDVSVRFWHKRKYLFIWMYINVFYPLNWDISSENKSWNDLIFEIFYQQTKNKVVKPCWAAVNMWTIQFFLYNRSKRNFIYHHDSKWLFFFHSFQRSFFLRWIIFR